MMKVPFLDLNIQYEAIKDEIDTAMQEVIRETAFVGGRHLQAFEEAFAVFNKTEHAIGVSNGTAALGLTLKSLGIKENDEVITSPNTFIATVEAISYCGATPVFVDVDEQTLTINPALIEQAITPRTKAIIPVHLFGQPADMDPIMALAKKHNLLVVEDACQAHDAEYKGRKAGSIGDAGCFSFYPGKNLGAYGDGGAIITNNAALVSEVKMRRDHGSEKKYIHKVIGWNERLDGIQAAILSVKLQHLPSWSDGRRESAKQYTALLADIAGIKTPVEADYAKHVYHIYGIRTAFRDELQQALQDADIGCGIHYPIPVHLQEAYAFLNLKEGSFPVAERSAKELLSLPMFPELTIEQTKYVVEIIKQFINKQERERGAS